MPHLQGWARPCRILLATDLGDLGYLLHASIVQATTYQAELLIVHVLPDAGHFPIDPTQMVFCEPERLREQAQRGLDEAVMLATAEGITCSSLLLYGDVVSEIGKAVTHWKANRLIAGSHGTAKFHLQILGSVAASLFHRVEVPILAVGPNSVRDLENLGKYMRIVAGISLDRHSDRLTRFALSLAEQHTAALSLVHVVPAISPAHPSAARVTECSQKMLQRLLCRKKQGISSASCEVLQGHPVDAIVAYARHVSATLILLGASAHSAFNEHFIPGTAYRVLCESPCPVLVLKHDTD